jgi:hypothetical protein
MDEELTILTNPADGNGPAAVISIGVPTGAAHHVIASTTSAAVLISIGVPTGAAHHVIASTTTKNSNETKSQRRNKW